MEFYRVFILCNNTYMRHSISIPARPLWCRPVKALKACLIQGVKIQGLIAKHNILSCERLTILECHVLPQFHCNIQTIWRCSHCTLSYNWVRYQVRCVCIKALKRPTECIKFPHCISCRIKYIQIWNVLLKCNY